MICPSLATVLPVIMNNKPFSMIKLIKPTSRKKLLHSPK